MSLSVSKKATEVVVMLEKINGPLIKVLYFLYNPASFIPVWTPTESILLFNWLLNQFLGLSFLLHHFFSISTWNIEIWNAQDVIILSDDFWVQYLSIIHHHASRKKKTTSFISHPIAICFKNAWISAKVHFVDYTI